MTKLWGQVLWKWKEEIKKKKRVGKKESRGNNLNLWMKIRQNENNFSNFSNLQNQDWIFTQLGTFGTIKINLKSWNSQINPKVNVDPEDMLF